MKPHFVAFIRESECIGCTKCLNACPTDAIIGAKNKMHTIIQADCTGCQLCIEPCPVDCIDMIEVDSNLRNVSHYKKLSQRKKNRMTTLDPESAIRDNPAVLDKKQFIQAALARVAAKKNSNKDNA